MADIPPNLIVPIYTHTRQSAAQLMRHSFLVVVSLEHGPNSKKEVEVLSQLYARVVRLYYGSIKPSSGSVKKT